MLGGAALAALLLLCWLQAAWSEEAFAEKSAPLKSVVLKIGGMRCEECARIIERALRQARGVRIASVSRAKNEARVTYDPQQTSVARLIETIEKIQGMAPYTATEAK